MDSKFSCCCCCCLNGAAFSAAAAADGVSNDDEHLVTDRPTSVTESMVREDEDE